MGQCPIINPSKSSTAVYALILSTLKVFGTPFFKKVCSKRCVFVVLAFGDVVEGDNGVEREGLSYSGNFVGEI